ncbi:hypothetical protein PHYBOEH_001186 [Phytophthora boehmeriae]|uniref:Uncharacterized protein n=1 Tax=Phytophthora boehmeriae TaxID=109152 RepID=A0A8T1WTK4_9STRA|nr:hypothetical protein PHYBOEH_001186 [Phytophthora boehmeriae]
MKSPAGGEQHCDVIYHRYPSKNFDDAQKPIPTALVVDPQDTDDEDASVRLQAPVTPSSSSEPSLCLKKPSFCEHLGRLLAFHTFNTVLGVGGAITVLVLVPLSVGLVPLFGLGILLFQCSASVVEGLARTDICLANVVIYQQPKLRKAFGIQSGFSTNNGCSGCCSRLVFLSRKMLLVMLYFATIKFAVGVLSLVGVWWGLVVPIAAISSGGSSDVIGWVDYHDHPGAYVAVVLGGWVIGVLCIVFVTKPSVILTKWACAEREIEDESDEYPMKAACDLNQPAADLEAAVVVTTASTKATGQ